MKVFKLNDYNSADTIAALATFPSTSALGIIKISGKKALDIVSRIFLPRRKKNLKKVKTYTLHYGWIVDKAHSARRIAHSGKHQTSHVPSTFGETSPLCGGRPTSHIIIDEVLVSVMRAPNSYTKEDVVEISCHGGILVLNRILEIILKQGARLALPGEFTYRAFLNGRIDLLQAESIQSIVESKSKESLALANAQLKGEASAKIREMKERVKELFIETEALINFPEDGVKIDITKIKDRVKILESKLNALLGGSEEARALKEGLRCVICGKTNVGKSTLFNCLFGQERVIVSKFAGTTRDVIEETINIRGVPLRIYDTAGILTPKDLLAKKAIEKSSQAFNEADLIILVLDGSRPLSKEDLFLFDKVKNVTGKDTLNKKSLIVAINKVDLKQRLRAKDIFSFSGFKVKLSALRNRGIKDLEQAVFKVVYKKGIKKEDMIFLSHYQFQVLKTTKEAVSGARQYLEKEYPIDFVNLALKESLDNLGKISGEVFSQELIENIFSNFCIGK
ncbi:MAG: tRNA uridine-5-carboxymethylaminomethyl(34) synthesis GTPase MnmE [Candidatus Omnitrophota bacterium]|nr:tRNA uridine-5-carboxymethylaminomethyl(34) synthesis GTPase MnmE [Candidatus Omnitrophota bacterium]